MTWPNVTVNQVNQLLGETNEVERTVLFIGTGTKNTGKTLAVNTQSDFDALLGEDDSQLKSDVLAAVANAGQNWWGSSMSWLLTASRVHGLKRCWPRRCRALWKAWC
jgi:hypothetical protein